LQGNWNVTKYQIQAYKADNDLDAEISHFFFLFHQSACLIGVNKSVARGSVKFSRTNGGEDEENDLKKFTIWRKEKI
jgi:hypothetical protein